MSKLIIPILLCLILVGCGTVETETREMPIEVSPEQPIVAQTADFVERIVPTPTPIPTEDVEIEEELVYYNNYIDYNYNYIDYNNYNYDSYEYSESSSYWSFEPTKNAGRFYVPKVGINVGLYEGEDNQGITDAADSAWYYNHIVADDTTSYIIADHCNQDFATLTSVEVGDEAYITNLDGSVTTLRAKEVVDGYNQGYIVDKNGRILDHEEGYLAYTCHGGGDGVRAVIFEEVVD